MRFALHGRCGEWPGAGRRKSTVAHRAFASRLALRWVMWLLLAMVISVPAFAATVHVAVASNFIAPMRALATSFEQSTGHKLILSSGATGKFYAQIRNDAPYEVLLAADADTPKRLTAEGLTVPGSGFTYAIGRLALWSRKDGVVDASGAVLKRPPAPLAIANPRVAPYGAAAVEVMEKLGVYKNLRHQLVQGENIAQAYQFVATGNAPLGFVAVSQILENGKLREGSAWMVPEHLHQPIRQDAVILKKGQGNPAAAALSAFLQSAPARRVIASFGYGN